MQETKHVEHPITISDREWKAMPPDARHRVQTCWDSLTDESKATLNTVVKQWERRWWQPNNPIVAAGHQIQVFQAVGKVWLFDFRTFEEGIRQATGITLNEEQAMDLNEAQIKELGNKIHNRLQYMKNETRRAIQEGELHNIYRNR